MRNEGLTGIHTSWGIDGTYLRTTSTLIELFLGGAFRVLIGIETEAETARSVLFR